jgi:hypothetical protein
MAEITCPEKVQNPDPLFGIAWCIPEMGAKVTLSGFKIACRFA